MKSKFDNLSNYFNKINFFAQEHPRNLIPELCRQFYHLGWVTGTGGGISIKHELVFAIFVPERKYRNVH